MADTLKLTRRYFAALEGGATGEALAIMIGFGLLTLLGSPATTAPVPEAKPDASAITVAIALPLVHNQRNVEIGKDARTFHVVVTNTTKQPVKLWREWCSWGYFNLSFEATDDQGKTYKLVKEQRDWRKNYPDALLLPPGEPYVIEVKFDPPVWDIPVPKGKADQPTLLKLKAIFEIPADRDTQQNGVWTGKVESQALSLVVTDHR